jgi:hypothetical protein
MPGIIELAENAAVREILESRLTSIEASAAINELLASVGQSTSERAVRRWRTRQGWTEGMQPEVLEVHPDYAELQARYTQLKRDQSNTLRQLYETKHKHQDYIDAMNEAITECIGRQNIAPVKPPPKAKATWAQGKPEVALALLSDMQTGKRTPTYNSEICAERVALYAEKIIKIAQVQEQDHPVRICRVAALGDLVEGCDIFPGQSWLIDSTLYTQLLDTTPVIIVDFVRKLLSYFDQVELEFVDGNHGRIGRKGQFGPMDNADRMVARIVKLMLRNEPRAMVTLTDPEGERNWYRITRIGNYSALMIHGDQIRGHSGFPWYGLGKKVQGWGSGGLGEDSGFLDVLMGHYHQLGAIPLNHRTVWANGSTESSNTFAQENLAAQSEPAQWLLFIDPRAGQVTASYGVRLR